MRSVAETPSTAQTRNELWHIRQPPGSSLCGHSCVSMALGIYLSEGIEKIGHTHGTKPAELAMVLRAGGFKCNGRRVRYYLEKGLPKRALLSMSVPPNRSRYHWVLLWDGMVHDPSYRVPITLDTWMGEENVTSYMEIR